VKADAAVGEEIDSLAPACSALRAFCSAKFLSLVGFIAPAQSALRPLPPANPFRHFPNASNPKQFKWAGRQRWRRSGHRDIWHKWRRAFRGSCRDTSGRRGFRNGTVGQASRLSHFFLIQLQKMETGATPVLRWSHLRGVRNGRGRWDGRGENQKPDDGSRRSDLRPLTSAFRLWARSDGKAALGWLAFSSARPDQLIRSADRIKPI